MTPQPASRLSYAPILLGIAFIATLFMVAESGYKRIHEAGLTISAAEERQALLSRYLRLVLDAETAQRGFLLTEDPRYLRGFDPAIRALDPMLNRIVAELRESGLEEDANRAQNLRSITGQKINEMESSLRLYGEVGHAAALQLLDTDIGQRAMTELRHELRELWNLEADRLEAARASSEKDLQTSRVLLGAASFLSLVLVVLVGALLGRDIRQREEVTENLGARNRELDRTVQQRTAMLFHLSSSLQKVAEREKAGLARERRGAHGRDVAPPGHQLRGAIPGVDAGTLAGRAHRRVPRHPGVPHEHREARQGEIGAHPAHAGGRPAVRHRARRRHRHRRVAHRDAAVARLARHAAPRRIARWLTLGKIARAQRRHGMPVLAAARADTQHGDSRMKYTLTLCSLLLAACGGDANEPAAATAGSAAPPADSLPVAPAIVSPDEVADPAAPPSYEVAIATAAAQHNAAKKRCEAQPEAVRTQCEQEANAAFGDTRQELEDLRGNQQ